MKLLRVELEVFRRQHRDLDEAIEALHEKGTADQLTLRRLKKEKLRLKDIIRLIEDRLTPRYHRLNWPCTALPVNRIWL